MLVLLDAAIQGHGHEWGDARDELTALRVGLAAANVTVLTSSDAREVSREDPAWQHGAFTKGLLDAFNDPAADINRNGLISTNGLAAYLTAHVQSLTGGAQTPGIEIRYDRTLFATDLACNKRNPRPRQSILGWMLRLRRSGMVPAPANDSFPPRADLTIREVPSENTRRHPSPWR